MSNEGAKKTIRFRPDPDPPAHLSEAAKAMFVQFVREYPDLPGNPVSLSILAGGLRAWDIGDAARLSVAKDGITVLNRYKQRIPNPMLKVEVAFMAEYRAAIKQLHFDLEPVRGGPGAPPARERR